MNDYQGLDGFKRLVHNLMLEEYMDEQSMPKDIFPMVWSYMKGLDRDTYLSAVVTFCDFANTQYPNDRNALSKNLA